MKICHLAGAFSMCETARGATLVMVLLYRVSYRPSALRKLFLSTGSALELMQKFNHQVL